MAYSVVEWAKYKNIDLKNKTFIISNEVKCRIICKKN